MFPEDLDLRQGETFSLELPATGVSGYVWEAQLEGAPDVLRAEIERRPAGKLPVGAATPEVLVIAALAPGEAAVLLTRARPWERGVQPVESRRITVRVR